MAATPPWSGARMALPDRDQQGDRPRATAEAPGAHERSASGGAGARRRVTRGPRGGDQGPARGSARGVRTYGPGVLPDARRVDPVARELDQYFAGTRRRFDIAVDLTPLTDFQRRILSATARVAFGDVSTYAKVATRAGSEKASRAAG